MFARRFAPGLVLLFACSQTPDDSPIDPIKPPPITDGLEVSSFSASASEVIIGDVVELTWTVRGADLVTLSSNGVPFHSASEASGSVTSSPIGAATTFQIVASKGALTARDELVVSVRQPDGPVILALTADPNPVNVNTGVATVSWRTAGATEVTLHEVGFEDTPLVLDDPNPADGSTLVYLFGDTAFVLQATDGSQVVEETVQITTTEEAVCGDGFTDPGETCDDGNAVSGDGCDSNCQYEFGGTITAPGGQATVTVPGNGSAAIQVVIDTDGQGIEAATSAAVCGSGLELALLTEDGSFLGWRLGDSDTECPSFSFPADAFATDLEAGTYVLEVVDYAGSDIDVDLTVTIHNPACGNGAWESLAGEQCDDGNQNDSDGCSNACQIQAAGSLTGPGAEQTFTGGFSAGESHFYEVVMSGDGYIRAETFVPSAGVCEGDGDDTQLDLLDANLGLITSNSDGGVGLCALIDPASDASAAVGAGTYFIRVWQWSDTVDTPAYAVTITTEGTGCGNGIVESGEQCDDGNSASGDGCDQCMFDGSVAVEVEPNDGSSSATPIGGTMNQTTTLSGAIDPATDADWFHVNVPAGAPATLTAQTYSALGDPSSCNNATTDTKIFLVDSAGVDLFENDDMMPGVYCSMIDGAQDPAAANLAPGDYYVRVEHYSGSAVINAYFLDVTVSR